MSKATRVSNVPSRERLGFAALSLAVWLAGCATATGRETEELVDDSVITAKVKSALVKDPDTSAAAINVETYKGVVQLSGFVRNDAERVQALALAKETQGVVRVDDKMTLKTEVE